MFNIKDLINNLNKATVLEVKLRRSSFVGVTIHIPTNDLDIIYTLYNSGLGFILHWEGMDMVDEDLTFDLGDFKLLHKEVLKEFMKREGV